MDLRRYAATLWSAAWLIALSLVLAVVIAVAVASQLPRTFESRATLYVGQSLDDPGLGYTSILASQAVAQSYAQLVTTRPVLEGAITDLGLDGTIDPDELAQRVTAEVPDQGVLLQILVRDADADQSSKLANAIAQQMLDRAPGHATRPWRPPRRSGSRSSTRGSRTPRTRSSPCSPSRTARPTTTSS